MFTDVVSLYVKQIPGEILLMVFVSKLFLVGVTWIFILLLFIRKNFIMH